MACKRDEVVKVTVAEEQSREWERRDKGKNEWNSVGPSDSIY